MVAPPTDNNFNWHLILFLNRSILWDGSPILQDKNYYHLFYFFRSLVVEQHREVLIYDLGGFLAAAGGNLGLCLGFSCLSVLFTWVDCLKAILYWFKCKQIEKD